ncbi:M48 family metallopeptidase [Mangrovibacterium sp.]|uniref:M48 family metallopeptidase n=1 Tax=Mangrovibacterium sp. TaxID=1961364 RepID=UPI003568BA8A
MKKTLFQGLAIIFLFLATWFLLNQIDWMNLLRIEKATQSTEEKLSELFLESFTSNAAELTDSALLAPIDSIVSKVCTANQIERETIHLHLLDRDEVNAFALPAKHLVIYSGLLRETDNPEELAGVIGHELAHIELNHVMKKLGKEIGLTALISMTGGNNGSIFAKDVAKLLSSTAFDRELEREADETALEYLLNAKINPAPLADFLYKLSLNETDQPDFINWISTHPDSKERAESLAERCKKLDGEYEAVISAESWDWLKAQEALN